MKKILVVAGDYPYPPIHGGRVDIWNRIITLKKLRYDIDLVVTTKNIRKDEEYNKVVKEYVNNIYLVKRKNRIIDLFSRLPLQVKSREALKKVEFLQEYDYVILEGDYVGSILENQTLKYTHCMLRLHNNEDVYFANLCNSTNNIIKKVYYYIDGRKFKTYEPILLEKCKNIMFISFEEYKSYKLRMDFLNAVFLPANVKQIFKVQNLKSPTVALIGSLFMENNKEGIIWYLKNVHQRVGGCVKNYRLLIAGNSKGTSIQWLRNLTARFDNIEIYDTPKTLDDIYFNSSIFINPMLHGAGVKLKTIEAIVNGLPVVSTVIGNEGTGLMADRDILVTNDAAQYAQYIISLLNDSGEKKQKLISSAQAFIKEKYNTEKILADYLHSLN